jgi:selenocysteine insertion sequence-binding protein 2
MNVSQVERKTVTPNLAAHPRNAWMTPNDNNNKHTTHPDTQVVSINRPNSKSAEQTAQNSNSTSVNTNQNPPTKQIRNQNHLEASPIKVIHSTSKKKSKKRKPTLSSMSIGDLIPENHELKRTSMATASAFQPSMSEFPELSAAPSRKNQEAPVCTAQTKTDEKEKASAPQSSELAQEDDSHKQEVSKKKRKKKKRVVESLSQLLPPKESAPKMDSHHEAALCNFLGVVGEKQTDALRLQWDDGKTLTKGLQRLRPKKKKFTSLKKKVLDERLRKWKECHPDSSSASKNNITPNEICSTVCLYGFCNPEELEDDDEYAEITENLSDMASKIGTVRRLWIPRDRDIKKGLESRWPAFVEFLDDQSTSNTIRSCAAAAAIECWSGLMLAGQELRCYALPDRSENEGISIQIETDWHIWCLEAERRIRFNSCNSSIDGKADVSLTEVILENALSDDELDDEDGLEECLSDIRALVSKFGNIESIHVVEDTSPPLLTVMFREEITTVQRAVEELSKVVIGGETMIARLNLGSDGEARDKKYFIRVNNLLSDEDLEDEDCLKESMDDVKILAGRFGVVQNVIIDQEGNIDTDKQMELLIYYSSMEDVKNAIVGFNGMIIGGRTVEAVEGCGNVENEQSNYDSLARKEPKQMLSGDKVISQRFVECKSVPKIPNPPGPRPYAKLASDENVKILLSEMLNELMRLQKRAIEEKNTKVKRRIVMGLREVARGIRSHKVKMVVMANNLDEYGAIDEKLQEIIDLAHKEGVPVFYEFSKRNLGKAIGKSIKVAVVGIQNPEGAHQQFKKLMSLATKLEII